MTYTQAAVTAVLLAGVMDVLLLRTRLLTRRAFWVAYAIMVGFQLLTNGVLTGAGIVKYDGEAIIGASSPEQGRPPFLGAGRIAYAPVEDLLFGFALILLTLSLWIAWGRAGVQREPLSGPPVAWVRRSLGWSPPSPDRPGPSRDGDPSPAPKAN